mmetsp:Transcript_57326/g.123267  ORF Transcript_57326/g.123267 Transcript_57326/m.123267 type:complete len:715 (+) Transcript_57326:2-2146(+)
MKALSPLGIYMAGWGRDSDAPLTCDWPETGVTARRADSRQCDTWLRGLFRNYGMVMRVRLVTSGELLVQWYHFSEDTTTLMSNFEERRQLREKQLKILLGESKDYKYQVKCGYNDGLQLRLAQVSKLVKLSESQRNAMLKVPMTRTEDERALLEVLRNKFDADLRRLEQQLEALEPLAWEPEVRATRVVALSAVQTPLFKDDEDGNVFAEADLDAYGGMRGRRSMGQMGWYLPRHAEDLFEWLRPSTIKVLAPDFRLDPRKEARAKGLTHLASYVGSGGGYLSPALGEVARLLDGGFEGLCVHAVPRLEGLPKFAIGALIGPSGSGKTTLAIESFGQPLTALWNEDAPALAHFSTFADAQAALSAVALDLQTAMRPVGLLSSGERERATLARGLAEWAAGERSSLVVDEFTSLLDRVVAKQVAGGITAFVRERSALTGLVLLSSNTDVVGKGMLEPDWVFDCGEARLLNFPHAKNSFSGALAACEAEEGFAKRRRMDPPQCMPPIAESLEPSCAASESLQLVVRRALPLEWRHFREHHYKDHRLQNSAICFVGELNGRPVAFLAALNPGINLKWMLSRNKEDAAQSMAKELGYPLAWSTKMMLREHRTVVLPDSQGLGLGSLMADMVAHLSEQMGYVFHSTTAHPTYGGYRDRSPLWVALPTNQRDRGKGECSTFSHIWLGSVRGDGTTDPERERFLRNRVSIEGSLVGVAQAE